MGYIDVYLPTIGFEKFEKKKILNYGKNHDLFLFDTSSNERFRSLVFKAIKSVQGIVLVFDVTNRNSFDNLEEWLRIIKENLANPIIILFGNKADSCKTEWTVNEKEIKEFWEKNYLEYFEVSSKNNAGINEGFSFIENKINDKMNIYS